MTDHSSSNICSGCPFPWGAALEGPLCLSADLPVVLHKQVGAVAGVLALILATGCTSPPPTQSQPVEPLPTEPVEFD